MTNKSSDTRFNVSASLIKRLGEEIVSDVVAALAELIKNAYDADADRVDIEINTGSSSGLAQLYFPITGKGFIKIEDNGTGMSWEEVQNRWMNFSFSDKKQATGITLTEARRSPTGGQGMGRIGTLRLGNQVELFTNTRQAQATSHVAFSWRDFQQQIALTDVPMFARQIEKRGGAGTVIIISDLVEAQQWEGAKGTEIVTRLNQKMFSFMDKRSFRVGINLNGERLQLGSIEKAEDKRVFIENVWQQMHQLLISEVMQFWESNKMLRPGYASEERARQVVLILRDKDTKTIVGLSTAGLVTFKQLNNNNFYLYRSIILPAYRHPGLTSGIIVDTRDYLESLHAKEEVKKVIGMLSFVENPRIQQFRREAIWPASKMAYIGMDKEGRHIRVYYFKGARI